MLGIGWVLLGAKSDLVYCGCMQALCMVSVLGSVFMPIRLSWLDVFPDMQPQL